MDWSRNYLSIAKGQIGKISKIVTKQANFCRSIGFPLGIEIRIFRFLIESFFSICNGQNLHTELVIDYFRFLLSLSENSKYFDFRKFTYSKITCLRVPKKPGLWFFDSLAMNLELLET
jgi:hypothetical protein